MVCPVLKHQPTSGAPGTGPVCGEFVNPPETDRRGRFLSYQRGPTVHICEHLLMLVVRLLYTNRFIDAVAIALAPSRHAMEVSYDRIAFVGNKGLVFNDAAESTNATETEATHPSPLRSRHGRACRRADALGFGKSLGWLPRWISNGR